MRCARFLAAHLSHESQHDLSVAVVLLTFEKTQQLRALLDVLIHGHGQPGFTAY